MFRILIGLAVIGLGFIMVYRPRFFIEFMGHQAWLEKIIQVSDDELAYKILGIVIMFIGAVIATGLITNILYFLFSPILNASSTL
jgi:hypothetical protein